MAQTSTSTFGISPNMQIISNITNHHPKVSTWSESETCAKGSGNKGVTSRFTSKSPASPLPELHHFPREFDALASYSASIFQSVHSQHRAVKTAISIDHLPCSKGWFRFIPESIVCGKGRLDSHGTVDGSPNPIAPPGMVKTTYINDINFTCKSSWVLWGQVNSKQGDVVREPWSKLWQWAWNKRAETHQKFDGYRVSLPNFADMLWSLMITSF